MSLPPTTSHLEPRAATEDVLRHALAALRDVVPYDLAAILRLRGERLSVAVAEGPMASPQVEDHELELSSFPTLRRAMQMRRPVPLEAHHHASDEGDPYDGVLDLPHGHSCMVIPLFVDKENLGLITLDRGVCQRYDDASVRIAGLYGELVSLTLRLADEKGLLERDKASLTEHNRLLAAQVRDEGAAADLEASSAPNIRSLVSIARQAAASRLPILIRGETGTGKEVLSQAIHEWSERAAGPFVKLNCAAIPENLVESELFGHVEGAFSGADRARPGRFAIADGGTLLLDEIGDLPLAAQAKLLRVLQEGAFEPVGADAPTRVDVRVLAATHVDLDRAVAEGRFREDLWYRLAVFPLDLPPLRERPDDAVRIARKVLRRIELEGRGGPWFIGTAAEAAIRNARWPGNVRELINVLERATVLEPEGTLEPHHLLLERAASATARAAAPAEAFPSFADAERAYLQEALERASGKLYGEDGAAKLVGLNPSTLRSKLVKHGLR